MKRNKDKKPEMQIRAATLEVRAATDDQAASVRMSVSSEEPVLTYGWFNDQFQRFWEILDHTPLSIDLARAKDGLVVLDRHYGDQIGLMDVEIDAAARKLGGTVQFCSGARAQEIATDAAKGLRRNVSVGYVVDRRSYVLEGERDGVPVVRAKSWMPFEASFEPVPADATVGVGRAADLTNNTDAGNPADQNKENTMDAKQMAALYARAAEFKVDANKVRALIEADEATAAAGVDALIIEAQRTALAAKDAEIAAARAAKPAPKSDMVPQLGGDAKTEDKIIRKFSVLNVARHLAGMKADVGFEREVTEEAAKQRGKPAEGIIIPFGVLANRAMNTTTSPGVVATNFGEYVDLLRTKYVIGRLGVTFLPGLVGNVALPKMTTGATGYWVAEADDVTGSTPVLGQVQGTPHTAGALVDISRTLLIQSTPSAEELVRNEIVERVMRTVQAALFVGSGSNGQPTGVKGTTSVNNPSVGTPGAPTYAEILGFPGDIMADNAEADGMQFVMTAEVWAKLAATLVGTDGGRTVLDPVTRNCVGYGYQVTEDVGANTLFFGNWASVVLGIWGNGIDVAATDSKLFASGGLTLRALQDVDIMIRHPQALAYNSAVTA